jgi:hypothetical protein
MKKTLDYIIDRLTPSIIFAGLATVIMTLVLLWDGIRTRYISKTLLPYEVSDADLSNFVFLYLDKDMVDTAFTVIFWAVMATIGIFIFWMLSNTYTSIYNILVVETEYDNKARHYLVNVGIEIAEKIALTLATIFSVLIMLKIVVPAMIEQMSQYLLAASITVTSVILTVLWLALITLALELIWQIIVYSIRFIKTAKV